MAKLAEIAGSGAMFLLGNHGCCGVPGMRDHSKESLQRSWWLGQGSLIDVIINRGGQLLASHDPDVSLTRDDAICFKEVADWAENEKTFLCLNLPQAGDAGMECVVRIVKLANEKNLAFAICSADVKLLRKVKKSFRGTETVYIESNGEDPLKEAAKAGCGGIIVECRGDYFDEVNDLFQKNKKRKKGRMAFLAHIASDFECAPWCAHLGMGFICDDPLEAVNEIMKYRY